MVESYTHFKTSGIIQAEIWHQQMLQGQGHITKVVNIA